MKRPLAVIGFSYLVTLVVVSSFDTVVSVVLILTAAAGLTILAAKRLIKTEKAIATALISCMIACVAFQIYEFSVIRPSEQLYGRTFTVKGEVVEAPYSEYGRYYYIIKTDSISVYGKKKTYRVRLSCPESADAQVSDTITFTAKFQKPDSGGYSSAESNYADRIILYAYLTGDECKVDKAERKTLYSRFVDLRALLNKRIEDIFPGSSGAMLSAMMLGDKSKLSTDLTESFRTAGMSHILAVSGLHVSIIANLIIMLLRKIGLGNRRSAGLATLGVVCFMALTGFSPSVMRAGIMSVIYYIGIVLDREADSLNSLGASCLLMAVFNPYICWDIGFKLSVLATLGILVVVPRLETVNKRILERVTCDIARNLLRMLFSSLSLTFASTILTLPVTALYFSTVSFIAPVSNVILVYPATLFLSAGLLSVVFSYVSFIPFIYKSLGIIAYALAVFIDETVSAIAGIPFAGFLFPSDLAAVCVAVAMIVLAFYLVISRQRIKLKICVLISVVVVFSGVTFYGLYNRNLIRVGIIDVGNGCSIAIKRNKECILIGCGGNSLSDISVDRYLTESCVSELSVLVLPSLDAKYANGIDSIVCEYSPEVILSPNSGERLDNLMFYAENSKLYLADNSKCSVLDDAEVTVLTDSVQANWVLFTYGKFTVLVAPENGKAEEIDEKYRSPDMLVLTSDDTYEDVFSPELTVCSGELSSSEDGENTFSTGEYGNIIVETRANGIIKIKTGG